MAWIYDDMADEGYAVGFLIGKGGFGAVYGGTKMDLETKELIPAAMKVIGGFNKRKNTSRYRTLYYPTELRILKYLRHPNLVLCFDVFQEWNTRGRQFDRRTFIWMERSTTDLYRMAYELPNHRIPNDFLAPLMSFAFLGLDFLHANLIAHRDLKPANILVFETPTGQVAKITDYSLIKEVNPYDLATSLVGTRGYQSPAMLRAIGYNPFKADVFAMGIVIFELSVGRRPNWNPGKGNMFIAGEFEKLVADVTQVMADHPLQPFLLTSVFTFEDVDRCTLEELMHQDWFPQVVTEGDPAYADRAIRGFEGLYTNNG